MREKAFKTISFVLILVTLDILTGCVLGYAFFKQKGGQAYSISHTLDNCIAPVIVFGNSRAQHHYVPSIFKNILGKDFYNSGIDGGHSIIFSEAIFSEMLKRHIPEIVIFEIDPKRLYYSEEEYDKLTILMPFLRKHPDFYSILNLRGPFEKVKTVSQSYRYNYQGWLNILLYGFITTHQIKEETNLGYEPLKVDFKGDFYDPETEKIDLLENLKIDTNEIKSIQKIIKQCQQKNIKLIFINSPVFSDSYGSKYVDSKKTLEELIKLNNIEYWDYSTDIAGQEDNKLFADRKHLNHKGAILFSTKIAQQIKEGL